MKIRNVFRNRIEFVGEDEMTTGEKIIAAACVVAIFAGCAVLYVMLWASQQPIN